MSERVDILLSLRSKIEGAAESIDFFKKFAEGLTVGAVAYKAFAIAKDSGELASQIKNLSAEANLTTDAFQALKLGGLGYDVTQEQIVRGAVTLRKNLEDAAKDGMNPLNEHLRRLNLGAAGLQALAPERQFETIGRAIANASDKEAAFAAGMELLGAKQAPKLLEFLRDMGVDGFDKMAKAARAMTLTKEELDVLDKASNRWKEMAESSKIVGARATLVGFSAADSIIAGTLASPEAKGKNVTALDTQIMILRNRIKSYEEHGRGDDPRASEYRRTLAILEARQKTKQAEEETAAAAEKTAAADRESAMHAAELAATLKDLNKQDRALRQEISAFDTKTLNEGIASFRKKRDQESDALAKEAENYKNLANPVRAYKLELDKLVILKRAGLLTDQEAAAAAKILTQRLLEQAGELGNHTRRLSELQEQRELIQGNPFLSAEQKRSQLGTVLRDENEELDKQIKILRERQSLTPEQGRQLDDLVKRRTANQFNPAGFSFGQEIGADIMAYANSFGTIAQQTAGVITNTIGRAVDGVARGIAGWITGTTSWSQVLMQIGTSVLEDIISALVRIGVQQVINATVGKTLQAAALATSLATTAVAASTISAMMITPATLSTIASFGGAALAAPEEILAALAASAPLGLFYQGGHTGPGGVVHADEWVAPSWMVNHPTYGGVIDMLEGARTGSSIAPAADIAGGGRPQRTIVIVPDMVSARALERDPEFDNVIVRAGRRNRGDFAA